MRSFLKILFRMLVVLVTLFTAHLYAENIPGKNGTSVIFLQSIPPVKPPEALENKLKYTIHFVFDTCPENHWVYYNKEKKQLIIDFYGIILNKSSKIVLNGIPAVKGIETINMKTSMMLNERRAQIILDIDSFWYYESSLISGNVLELKIWKYFKTAEMLGKNKKKLIVPFLIVSISAAVSTVLLLFLLNK